MKPTFTLINKSVPFIFVIPPSDLSWDHRQSMEGIDIIDFGEKIFSGKKKATRVNFSGFFPGLNSNFFSTLNPLPPLACIELLKSWKDNEDILKFLIPEWGQHLKCRIESIREHRRDHTGDIYYEISLIEEFTHQNLIDVATGLYRRLS